MSMQTIILDAIKERVDCTSQGGTLVIDREFANTGTLRYLPNGTFTPINATTFSFQSTYVIFGGSTSETKVAGYWYDGSTKIKTVEELVEIVAANLTTGVMTDPWADDAIYGGEDWRDEVSAGNTRLGYAEWVRHQYEMESA